jgi:peptidoglycan-associated lipoprotein
MRNEGGRVAARAIVRGAALIAVAFALYGCKSSAKQEPPAQPEDTGAVSTAAPVGGVTSEVDAMGNPIDPATGTPLARVFYFEYDRAVLRPDALTALEGHASYLRGHPDRRAMVEGHCDERGTREYNLALGERRGEAVRTFLVSSGVSRSQIEVVSYGEERPADPGHSEAAWAANRRAELIYR